MKRPSDKMIALLREKYPAGTRIELIEMKDRHAPEAGTRGTVQGVDYMCDLLIKWDNGSDLKIIIGEDIFRKLDGVTTVCYGKKRKWDDRQKAEKFFLEAMDNTRGAERERYSEILAQIQMGYSVCKDSDE